MNYELGSTWKTLSTIMGESYDATKEYRVHVNGDFQRDGFMRYTTESSPNETDVKSVAPAFSDVYFEAAANPSLKSHKLAEKVSIDVTEVA